MTCVESDGLRSDADFSSSAKLKAVLVKRENKLKAAIEDVEEALGRLRAKTQEVAKKEDREG